MGDVNGIGPEVLAKALSHDALWHTCSPIVVGDAAVLDAMRTFADPFPSTRSIDNIDQVSGDPSYVAVMNFGCAAPNLAPGTVHGDAGRCAVTWTEEAVRMAQRNAIDAIVTCPITKEGIRIGGCPYSGHTDLIAAMTESPDYRMCLFAGDMRIVHISGHHPLAEAITMVRPDRIATSIRIADSALARLGLPRRRIAVAGLNPHAGEGGMLGEDEARWIQPAIETCRAEGIDCVGPASPDAVFRHMREGLYDVVVAMYHDQGHIPLKLIAMDEGVNVTLGIPIVRTSVDHGTAYDIAGKGLAREESLLAAVTLAARLAAGSSK